MNKIKLFIENIAVCMAGNKNPQEEAYGIWTNCQHYKNLNFDEALEVLKLLIFNHISPENPILTHTIKYQIIYQKQQMRVTLSDGQLILTPTKTKDQKNYTVRIICHAIGRSAIGVVAATTGFKLYITPSDQLRYISEKNPKAFKYYTPPYNYHEYSAIMEKEQSLFQLMHGGTRPVINHGNRIFLMMKRFPGMNLKDIILNKHLSKQEKIIIAYKCILEVMRFHALGWIHCDIKPEQFLCYQDDTNWYIYLVDFGAAVHVDNARCLNPDACLTTIVYAASEIFLNHKNPRQQRSSYNQRVDVYALGITFAGMFLDEDFYYWVCSKTTDRPKEHLSNPPPGLPYTAFGDHLPSFIARLSSDVKPIVQIMTKIQPQHRCSLQYAYEQMQQLVINQTDA